MAVKKKRSKTNLTKIVEEMGAMRQKQIDDQRENDRRLAGMRNDILGLPAKQDVTDLRNLIVDDNGELKLATKEDVGEVLNVFKNLKTAAGIIGGTGHWTWKILMGIAMLVAVLTFISSHAREAGTYLINKAIGL